jgi:hypothetical protein
MKAIDFLGVARALGEVNKPAHIRTSISRSYFAAHHAALEFLLLMNLVPVGNANGHEIAILALDNSGDNDVVAACGKLRTLRGERNLADYHFDVAKAEQQALAKMLILDAEQVFALLRTVAADPARMQAVEVSIRAWAATPGQEKYFR